VGLGGALHPLGVLFGLGAAIGNAAYGFEAIHQSFGDIALVDRGGAAILIKSLGLLFPASLALIAVAIHRIGHPWNALGVLLAALLWPIAHIANVAPLAVGVNVMLVVALGTGTRWTPPRVWHGSN